MPLVPPLHRRGPQAAFLFHRLTHRISLEAISFFFGRVTAFGSHRPVKNWAAEDRGVNLPAPSEITGLLIAWSEGDQAALERLLPLVERELHRIARNKMRRERPGHTLQPTALVNEAYLRLVDQRSVRWQNRAHFFAIAAALMRRILVNHARDRHRLKRGGGAVQVSLSEAVVADEQQWVELIELDEALDRLAGFDERACRVFELRYFGGLTAEETAEVLGVSVATVERDWKSAKAWLQREIRR